jgi:TolA-binding protein
MNASYYIGRSEYEAHDFADAELELTTFEATYPDSEYLDDARYYLGRVYYDQGLWASAIAPFDRVIEIASEGFTVGASYYGGRSRFELGDMLAAIPEFRRVLELDPQGMFGDNSQYYIGRSLFEAGDLAGSVPELLRAEIDYPDSEYMDSIRYYLGRAYYDRALFGDAVAPFERLIEIPTTTLRDDGLFLLGRSRYEIGHLPSSLPPMQEIESGYPASNFVDNCLYWQARIYTDLRDCDSARAAVDRLRTSFPTSSELTRATSYLASHGC